MIKDRIKTPGKYLANVLEIFDVTFEELIKYALITEEQLYHIIDGNNLIPWSVAQYLKINYDIPTSLWKSINCAYSKQQNRRYIGVQTGHEMLLNIILFEKD